MIRKVRAFSAQSGGNNEVVMAAAGIFEARFECHGHHREFLAHFFSRDEPVFDGITGE
jgi:hypothetical protein